MRIFDIYRLSKTHEPPLPGLYAIGLNGYGQLGLGDTVNRNQFVRVGSASNWTKISAGRDHVLALNSSGELYSCGRNYYGQLGKGDTTDRSTFTRVGSASNWTQISAGDNHSLALNSNGELYSCGYNGLGQLGLGDMVKRMAFTRVGSASNWTQISAGRDHSLALNSNGELYSCGSNIAGHSYGQLGLGEPAETDQLTFARVGSASNWTRVTAGMYKSFALNSNGELYSCGENLSGHLGLGDMTNRNVFTRVGSASNWTQVAAGMYNTFALNSNGELYSCGSDNHGVLGLGSAVSFQYTFARVGTASNWTRVTTNYQSGYALNSSGVLYSCGWNNYGQLGLGDTVDRPTFTHVGTACNWVNIAMGPTASIYAIAQ